MKQIKKKFLFMLNNIVNKTWLYHKSSILRLKRWKKQKSIYLYWKMLLEKKKSRLEHSIRKIKIWKPKLMFFKKIIRDISPKLSSMSSLKLKMIPCKKSTWRSWNKTSRNRSKTSKSMSKISKNKSKTTLLHRHYLNELSRIHRLPSTNLRLN